MILATYHHLVLSLRMSGYIYLLHLYALMVWTGTTLLSMEIVNIVCKSDKNIYLNRQEVKSVHSVQQYYLLGLFTVD